MKHSPKIILRYLIFGVSTVIFGLINIAWHSYSDYKISYWIAKKVHKINLTDYWLYYDTDKNLRKENVWLLNSFYIDLSTYSSFIYIAYTVLLMITSGFIMTKIVEAKLMRKKVGLSLYFALIVLWIVKIPIEFKFSNYNAVERGLFAW